MFKHLYGLPGNHRPPDSANQLLGLAAKHTATNHLNSSAVMSHPFFPPVFMSVK
jgi:hypothetical protein